MTDDRINGQGPLTIAAVAGATGISEHTLRAWERRYGIPRPGRSACRYRLYDAEDVELIEAMRRLIARGLRPAAAAARARADAERCPEGVDCDSMRRDLLDALLDEDEHRAAGLFGTAAEAFNPCRLVAEVLQPVLHGVGDAWERGDVGPDVEHFASGVLRTQVEMMATRVEPPAGRLAVLSCAPGERHELAILCLRLRLAHHGWRSHVLGGDLPGSAIVEAVVRRHPALAAISVTRSCCRDDAVSTALEIRARDPGCRVVLGGQGMGDADLPEGIGSERDFWEIVSGT